MLDRRRLSLVLIATAFLSLSACDGGGDGDGDGDGDGAADGSGDGDGDACNPDDRIEWDGTVFAEAMGTPDSFEDCDPHVSAIAWYEMESIVGEQLESVSAVLLYGKLPPANNTFNIVTVRVSGPGTPVEVGVAYPMGPSNENMSFFEGLDTGPDDNARLCHAAEGEATLTSLGDVGEELTGTYTVTAWTEQSDASCPLPATGSFQIVREN